VKLVQLDVHHNYATKEELLGRTVWVHRKGAIVLIPGSMGTASYVARGLGEPASSAPHLMARGGR
jgi:tRNA-splicing ligase RtcB